MKAQQLNDVKVALVYDHLTTEYGGAELVLQVLHQLFPKAPLFTTVYRPSTATWAKQIDVRTGFLQKLGPLKYYHHILAPLHPLAFESIDLSPFDLIISITSGAAKGVLTLPHQLHVCYLLTPPRYLSQDSEYVQAHQLLSLPVVKRLTKPLFSYLQRWDTSAAWRPDKIIAISQLVAQRSELNYGRTVDAVVYPPFDETSVEQTAVITEPFFLCLTRLVSYKKIDLAIQACIKQNKILVIAGEGPARSHLEALAGVHTIVRSSHQSLISTFSRAHTQNKTIIFTKHCSEKEKSILLSSCTALLMPGEEDFGLTGLEAAAYGKPVLTYHKSGIAEILKHKVEAVHIPEQSIKAVSSAIASLADQHFSPKELQSKAKEYSIQHFQEQFDNTIYQFWQQHSTISPVKQP